MLVFGLKIKQIFITRIGIKIALKSKRILLRQGIKIIKLIKNP